MYLYSRVRTGWRSLTTTCPVRALGQASFSVSPLYNLRIPPVSHCWSGSGQILFPFGRRLSHCARSYDFCGTTGIICQRTRTEWCGGRGAPIVLKFNYWYRRQEDRNYFWLTDWGSSADLEMFGTMIVVGPTPDQGFVLIPDSTTPTVDADSPADLQHVVGLSLGSAENLSSTLPPEGLHLALCDKSLRPTLGLGCQDYWSEVTPILRKWQSVNDASCPHCRRVIRVYMSHHLRAGHTECQCFWRCPVSSCPMWFTSELNGKDHLERIHNFKEGQGYSFNDCLRQFGLEWFGRRSFFDKRDVTGQGLWMDLALARKSGQALHNNYVITNNPTLAPLRKFFRAAVRNLTSVYENRVYAQTEEDTQPSICAQMRRDISQEPCDLKAFMYGTFICTNCSIHLFISLLHSIPFLILSGLHCACCKYICFIVSGFWITNA